MSGSSVTVPSATSGVPITLTFVGSANIGLANQISGALLAASNAHTLDVIEPYSGGAVPVAPSGTTIEELVLSSSTSGSITVPAAASDIQEVLVVSNTQAITIHGSSGLSIVGGGPGALTIDDPALIDIGGNIGSTGTVSVTFTAADSPYLLAMGQGFETVNAQGSGTITGGTGPDVVNVTGPNDVITAGSDGTTVNASGFASSINGGLGTLSVNDSGYLDTILGSNTFGATVATAGFRADVVGGSTSGAALNVVDTGLSNTIQAGAGTTAVTLDGTTGRTRGGTGSFSVLAQTANNTIIGGTAGLTSVTIAAGATSTEAFGRAGNMSILDRGVDALIGSGEGTASVTVDGAGTGVYGGQGGTLNVVINAASVIAGGLGANTTVDASSSLASGALVFGGFEAASLDGSLSVLGGADQLLAVTGGSNATIDAATSDTVFTGVFIGTGAIAGNVLVNGSASALQVQFVGGAGSSTVMGGAGAATLFGADFTASNFVGSSVTGAPGGFLDAIGTNAGSETLNAGTSTTNDTLFASHGNDSLIAGSGKDFIDVGANTGSLGGAETVTGGTTVQAGSGSDLIVFSDGTFAGGAVITNFTASANNSVLLSGYGSSAAGAALAGATTNAGNTTITLSDHTSITFVDTTVQQLTGHLSST